MGKVHGAIDEPLAAWIAAQPLFFVATAPSGDDGHVNVSPKGHDTLRVLGPTRVAYLDLTGSGVETIAHLRDNGRITVMLCAFDGPPRIVRLQGTGTYVRPGDDGWAEAAAAFPDLPGARAVILVDCDRIADSCGYSIPKLQLVEERPTLLQWAERKGPDGIDEYWADRNAVSIDGLPGLT